MTDIVIPDFSQMPDDELHAWEFTVYDVVPGEADLADIIGEDPARRYYAERGRRIDLQAVEAFTKEINALTEDIQAAKKRLESATLHAENLHRR